MPDNEQPDNPASDDKTPWSVSPDQTAMPLTPPPHPAIEPTIMSGLSEKPELTAPPIPKPRAPIARPAGSGTQPPIARPQPAPEPTQTIAPVVSSPTPFSSIGSTPVVEPPVVPNTVAPAPGTPNVATSHAVRPSTAPRSAAVPLVEAPSAGSLQPVSGKPASVVPVSDSPRPRRRWPLALLALLTILGSGALSWAVATWVGDNDTPVLSTPVSDDAADSNDGTASDASAQPAMEDLASPTVPSATRQSTSARTLEDEPFAQAAEIIRPSVVQLNLGQGLGTGVIINENGTILTAAHVVGDNTRVQVTFFDGSSVEGEVIGAHTPTDVAVVMVDPGGRNLVAATLADGDQVRVGQLAVAVGSPFGFDQTVTAGIISAVDRIVNSVSMVQTDAPINPGNSGGPLINLQGEVVGINDLIFTQSGTSAGVGFAISIDLAVIIADQIIAGVEPQVALLGVSTAPPSNGARGAQVAEVVGGSAADDAGLQVGDVVIALDGVNTRGTADLRAQVIDQAPGSTVEVLVLRDGEEVTLTATLGQTG